MKELSQNAKAVADASFLAPRFYPALGAALRAVVTECATKRHVHRDSLITELLVDADDILAIAAELEAP
jgi:hypothetical protein